MTPEPVPGTEAGDLDIARQWLAREEYKEALKTVEGWIKTYGTASDRHAEALYVQGTAQLELGEYRDAHDTYQKLLNDYPGSEYAEKALSADFRIAEQYMAGKRRKALWGLLRVRDREAGVKIMDDVRTNYSDTPLAELAQKTKADYFYARGEFEQAETEYSALAREYPRSRYHPYALLQSARSALASFPGIKFDDAALVEAQERFTQFQMEYPDVSRRMDVPVILDQISARRADKTLDIARFYDKTGQRNAARYYYRATVQRYPGTPAASEAEGRLSAMGEPVEQAGPAAAVGRPAADKGGH